ncbi:MULTISPECIES: DUF1360 domain-containing protein [Streptomycetaceae]|uniref:DUF1360 domain-containing protein n=1 Tax=Streptomycetaceae TaxID=2062 RepID=UPI000A656F61|nr:DUF1360 domain-containing protein [Streptantibioticus cattleyicolor]
MRAGRRVGGWWTRIRAGYEEGQDEAGDERPLTGYTALLAGYATLTAAATAAVLRWRGRPASRPAAGDLALLAVATFRISRMLAKDSVMTPLRAPFTTYQGTAGPGEVMEAPRPGPVRHAVGELVTCPFCLTQWVATAGLAGLVVLPRTTRWITGGMTAVAAADALQLAYARLQQAAE